MTFKTDLEIELQRDCNLARWNDLGKLKKEDVSAYELGWNDFKRMLYDPLRESQNTSTSDEALPIGDVVGRSEQLLAFHKWYQQRGKMWRGETGEEVVKDFLSQ